MKQFIEDTSAIRQYLLGNLPEAEKQLVEEMFLLYPEQQENVLITEDALIEDYLDGNLTESEQKQFVIYFLATPQQVRKVQVIRSLKKCVVDEVSTSLMVNPNLLHSNYLGKLWHWLNRRNPFVLLTVDRSSSDWGWGRKGTESDAARITLFIR